VHELLRDSWPFFVPALLPAIALLTAGSLPQRGRTIWAVLLALPALGLVGDVLLFDHSFVHTLEVPNVFGRGPRADPHVWILDEAKAPAWLWHVAAAAFLAGAALWIFVRRKRPPGPPPPIAAAFAVSLYYLALRLTLEKTAAPIGIVWAVGTTPALVVILPLFAWHCGRRGHDLKRWVRGLGIVVLLQRLTIVAISYVATTQELGTHLDVHRLTDLSFPGKKERVVTGAVDAWAWAVALPQLTLWWVASLVLGFALGLLPWWLARRRAAATAS
jgi:hypothetical protein